MKSLVEQWKGDAVITRFDKPTGTWMFIAMHRDRPNGASGGTRMKSYPTPEDGLIDAMRLAEGMTSKWASIDFDVGGAKAVLALARPLAGEERAELFRRYGDLVDMLRGAFSTGVDLGTTPADFIVMRERTPYVHGVGSDGSAIDPGPYTARGVYAGLKVVLEETLGSSDPAGRTILIQGLGGVGGALADYLHGAGAELLVSDLNGELASRTAERVGGRMISAEEIYSTDCDVFAPCAVGGILNRVTIGELACRAVAGSANNQLAESADAERLHERGILYAPDYVVNAGGALAFGLMARGLAEPGELMTRVEGIGESLRAIFSEAARGNESPLAAAARRVERFRRR